MKSNLLKYIEGQSQLSTSWKRKMSLTLNWYRMFFVQASTHPSMHQKLTKRQNNQLPTASHAKLEDDSHVAKLWLAPKTWSTWNIDTRQIRFYTLTILSHRLRITTLLSAVKSTVRLSNTKLLKLPWCTCYHNVRPWKVVPKVISKPVQVALYKCGIFYSISCSIATGICHSFLHQLKTIHMLHPIYNKLSVSKLPKDLPSKNKADSLDSGICPSCVTTTRIPTTTLLLPQYANIDSPQKQTQD